MRRKGGRQQLGQGEVADYDERVGMSESVRHRRTGQVAGCQHLEGCSADRAIGQTRVA